MDDERVSRAGAIVYHGWKAAAHDSGTRERGRIMSEDKTTHENDFLRIVAGELNKLKTLGDKAIAQVDDDYLRLRLDEESNSIDILVRHLAGNMLSRWTDFLTTDGEKPSRNRDAEFEPAPNLSRADLLVAWEKGWACLFGTLALLRPENLRQVVRIAGKELSVTDAILRQFAHYAAHVGQIVFLAKHFEGSHWQSLSVPRKKPGKP
jgi:hypothetical protein